MRQRFTTQIKLLTNLKKSIGATELSIKLGLSKQIIHRHLKELVHLKYVLKMGNAPKTKYCLNRNKPYTKIVSSYKYAKEALLPVFQEKHKDMSVINFPSQMESLNFMVKSSVVYSSNIEGVSVTLHSFIEQEKHLHKQSNKESVEVLELLDSYNFAREQSLTIENFLQSHKLLSKSLVIPSRSGKYRKEPVGVFGTSGLVYLGVEDILIPNEMTELFKIINDLLNKELSVGEKLFWASWLHLELALVHPFSDGNGRMARLLEKWFLAEVFDEKAWFLQTEKFYFENRNLYYKNLSLGVNYWEADTSKSTEFISMIFELVGKDPSL